jgi:hypothetical protein
MVNLIECLLFFGVNMSIAKGVPAGKEEEVAWLKTCGVGHGYTVAEGSPSILRLVGLDLGGMFCEVSSFSGGAGGS